MAGPSAWRRALTLGLLPALGSGMRELAASGQTARLLDGYLQRYVAVFERVRYFSYLPESLAEFTNDPRLLQRVEVFAPPGRIGRGRRAVTMPWAHAAAFRGCDVLRVFQVTGVIPAVLAGGRWGVPYVTTYGFWYGRLSRPGGKRLVKAAVERIGLRRAAAVIVPTEELRARAARFARRVELIPNGVDTALFTPDGPEETRRGAERRVVYVGRLSAEKNLSTLVRALARLGGRPPVRLTLVGAGPLERELRAEASAAGLDAEFPGVVDQRRLPAVYRLADAFVLPSFTEGHPKALLEAMSSGVACVASSCAGNRSLVTDGETGLLFDPTRPDELAACLERVLGDRALAAKLGQAGRALVTERYDLAACVEREIALLRAVAGGSRAPRRP